MSARLGSDLASPPALQPLAYERLLRLALKHPTRAEQELVEWLDAALRSPPGNEDLFELLEDTRSFHGFVHEAAVRHYLDKAPHFDHVSEAYFRHGVEAIHQIVRCYTFCANLDKAGDPVRLAANPSRAHQLATVLHRCLHYNGMTIFEHYRAKRELPAGVWARHHALYATASRLGVTTLQIDDHIFEETRPSHCQAAYVTPLLVEQAGPYGRSARELNLIWQWAEKAAPKVGVRPRTPTSSISAFGIELDQDAPLRPLQSMAARKEVLQLETGAVTGRLRLILDELARGVTPERLGLCGDNIEYSKALLEQLASLWSLDGAQRRLQPRHGKTGMARVCAGFPAMHHFTLTTDPNTAGLAQLKRLERSEVSRHEEKWEIIDRSATGLRLACHQTAIPVANRQLLALRPDDAPGYRLGQVVWLRREQSGRLLLGLALLPGTPQAVCIRNLSPVKGEKSSFMRAFLLQREHGHPGEPSLLLPADLPGRFGAAEVLYDRSWQITLGEEIQRGADFVRIALGNS